MLQILHKDALFVCFLCLLVHCIYAIRTTLGRVDKIYGEQKRRQIFSLSYTDVTDEKI